MDLADSLNLLGRVLVAFYFLWSVGFNYRGLDHHIGEFKRVGIEAGRPLTLIGIAMTLIGGLLLVYTPTAVWGAAILVIFTVAADALFHRFWTYSDPGEMTIHKFFLFEHVALIGGIVGKTLLYTYDDGATFRTSLHPGDRLTWEAVAGPTRGATGDEHYAWRQIADGILFLHWVEKDGLAVAQTVDLNAGRVVTALIFPGKDGGKPESVIATGTVKFA